MKLLASGGHASLRTGLLAGFLNGLIGIGGGIVIVPAMVARGAQPQEAVGTSLAAVAALSGMAFVLHASLGGLSLGGFAFSIVVACGIAGSLIGGWILSRLSVRRMLLLFALLVFALSLRLTVQGLGPALGIEGGVDPLWPGEPTLSGLVSVGLASGVLSGMFGVGGGALVVLGLAVLFGMSVQEGLPIALAVNVTNALVGAIRHSLAGRVRARDVGSLLPSALLGIGAGAALALWLPEDALRVVFGAFFCYMGINIARKAFAQPASA